MLAKATAASLGIVRLGQFAGSRNQLLNFSKLATENVPPSLSRVKNEPLLATIVATRASDLPPHLASSASYESATVRKAFSYASFMPLSAS